MKPHLSSASRYSDVPDRPLAAALTAEDVAERNGLSPFERTTCRTHRRWIHDCIASPMHVVMVSGYRWCRRCQTTAMVSVDHLLGTVQVLCPRCWRAPDSIATAQIVSACSASLAAARAATHHVDAAAA
jgi:methylphosphotriester-DNA--protein-cysteine methyltransferase